jgi:hypothetical protein
VTCNNPQQGWNKSSCGRSTRARECGGSFHCQVKQKSVCTRDLEAIPKLQSEWIFRTVTRLFTQRRGRIPVTAKGWLTAETGAGCGLGRLQCARTLSSAAAHKLWLQKRVLGGEMDVEEEDKWSGVVRVEVEVEVEVEVSIKLHVMNAMFDIGRPQYIQETVSYG